MRIGRFSTTEGICYGVIEGEIVRLLAKEPFDGIEYSGKTVALKDAKTLAPCTPGKIVAVGLNYRDHIAEMKHDAEPLEPVIFMKPSTCVIGPDDNISRPKVSQKVDYEAEVAAVIAKPLYKVTAQQAKEGILGFTILNDVTARDIQRQDGQWIRGKGYDTFAPIGPWIVTDFDPCKPMKIQAIHNGQMKQDSVTNLMIHDPYVLISFISQCMTLLPGDVVTTGTPAGVDAMVDGDTIEIRVEGIGSLTNYVVDEK